ncbi:MAG: type II secretion system F family protein [Elusimicrobiota bacterium]|jgi:tight adherence protein C|nr:type II secretion system F family protein [Elusimicrobiota bacterium]
MVIFIISIFIGCAVFYGLKQILSIAAKMRSEGKVYMAITKNDKSKKIKDIILPTFFRLADTLGKYLVKIKNKKFIDYIERLKKLFKLSGEKYAHFNAYQFFVLQIFAGAAGFLFSMFFISSSIVICFIFAGLGFGIVLLQLKEECKKRKNLILRQLPETADLLSVMLEAGSDFFGAISKTAEILQGPLSQELSNCSAKIALGYDRKKALFEIADACDAQEVTFFIKTINMALESGAGMADTLKKLGMQIRQRHQSLAEKKAQEAPVKILIPLILFIFPTIFIVIFGPIVINLIRSGGF